MTPVLAATIGGLVTALCWGTGDWLAARSSKKHDPFSINFAVQVVGLLIIAIIWTIYGFIMPAVEHLSVILAAAVFITAAYLFFIKALSTGSVGIVVPLGNSYPLLTLILSLVFLGSIFSGAQIFAMVSIVLGAVLLAYEKNHKKVPLKVLHRETLLALIAASFWGVAFFLLETVVNEVPWYMLVGLISLIMTFISVLLLLIINKSAPMAAVKKALANKTAVIAGVILAIGSVAYYVGSERAGSVIIPTVISAGGPLVASALGAVVDKERIGVYKRMGAVAIVAGIIILNVF